MALRMLAYVSLLYQELVKTGEVAQPGELPPVFPLVVHHGSSPWRAARDMQGLFAAAAPEPLAAYRPHMRYFVLDEHRAALPDTDDNLVAHLIALEKSSSPQETRRSIMHLHRHLTDPRHDTLRRAFTRYIQREGRERGLQEGLHEGHRHALRTLLQARFGPLPDWAESRQISADAPARDTWTRAVLTAASLEDIIGPAA